MEIYRRISAGYLSRCCCFLLSVLCFPHEASLQETVVGFIGSSAVLPCSSKEHLLTNQNIDVRWRNKYDFNVYDIINGKASVKGQDKAYKNRAESFSEEYLRGNFSIKLNNLQHSDTGKYTCYIFKENSEDHIVELQIEDQKDNSPTQEQNQDQR